MLPADTGLAWSRPRRSAHCPTASPTWTISGSGGVTAQQAWSMSIAWWH